MSISCGPSRGDAGLAAALIGFSTDLLTVLDAAGRVVYASPSYQPLLGYAPAALLHTPLLDCVHVDDQAQVQTALTQLLEQPDRPCPVAYRHRHADGSWRGIEATLHNRLTDPSLAGVVVVGRAAPTLPLQNRLVQQVLDALPEAVMVVDAAGRYILNNRASQAIHGDLLGRSLPLDDAESLAVYGLRRPDGAPYPPLELPLQRALRDGEVVQGEQLLVRGVDQRDLPVLVKASPLRHDNGAIIGAIALFQDISILHAAQAMASQATARLQALQEVTDAALAHLSLDAVLRQVIRAITDVLQVDNTAILLLDEAAGELRVHVAHGPEEKVADQVRVPLGQGLAGQIAARGEALIVDDITQIKTVNPFLRQKIRSLMGVPLRVNNRVIGVLHVGTLAPRRFTTPDLQWLELAADRVALAIAHANRYETERVARQEAAAQAAELAAIFEAISDAVFVYDREGQLRHANAAAHALNQNLERPGYLDQPFAARVSEALPRDGEGHPLPPEELPVARVLHGERFVGAESVDSLVCMPDGRDVLLSVTGAPIRDVQGTITGGVIVTRDVTERRQSERRTHQALQALLTMAQTLVQPLDAPDSNDDRPLTSVAQRLVDLTRDVLGCTRVALVATDPATGAPRPLAVAGLSPELEQIWWNLMEHLQEPWPPPDPALQARFQAGEVLVIDVTQPPLGNQPDPFGIRALLIAPLRIAGTLIGSLTLDYGGDEHDYTPEERALAGAVAQLAALVIERERLQRERAEAQANALALREVNRRMDEFLSIASHELRSPLTIVRGNLQLMRRRLQRAQAQPDVTAADLPAILGSLQQHLKQADDQTARLNRMMADLLDVARIQSDHLDLHLAPFNLLDLVRRYLEEVRLDWPERSITLQSPDTALKVMADADRIGQVVTNLLTNALKYSAPGMPVVVSLRAADAAVRVEVRDLGPGLTEEQQEAIWERYRRVQGVTVQDNPRGSGGSLGLGLYISRMIITRHGGEVGVASAPGHGSTFWFTLPRPE